MAQVWVARMRGKHGFEKLVAVKTILPKYATDEMFQKMFLDEARIASRIEHNNVAQTLDLGEQHGTLFIVMEWVDGEALTKLLGAVSKRGSKVPVGIILRVLADTCGGLHAAHELRGIDGANLGVVHRDVSPQNILLSARGVAKLIDFGIAKARDRMSGETSAGLVKGKIKYMAPEQALGRPVDRRVDVWAIGAILYRTLAGRPAFAGNNELEMLHSLTSGKPPLPMPKSVPTPIGNVALRALAHDAERRFATAGDLQAAMEQAMIEAGVVTTTGDVQAFIEEHLPDRAKARKQMLDLAIAAGRERDRMQQLLQAPMKDSSSGILDVGSRVMPVGGTFTRRAPSLHGIPPTPAPPPGSAPPHDPDGDVTVALAPTPLNGALWVRPSEPPPELLSAPGDTVESVNDIALRRRRQQLMLAVGAGVSALGLITLIAIAVTRGSSGDGHAVATTSLAAWSRGLRLPATAETNAPIATAAPTQPAPTQTAADPPYALAATPAPAPPKPIAAPTSTPTTAPKPTTTTPKKPRVDMDGF
jgi:serine/threonine-protein kinase